MLTEIEECVATGLWVGDCFIYTNNVNRLNYYVGGEIVTIAHLDRLVDWILKKELESLKKRKGYLHAMKLVTDMFNNYILNQNCLDFNNCNNMT